MHSPIEDAHAEEEDASVPVEGADDQLSKEETDLVTAVATVGVVAVGAAVFEAALLPGLALGVAAMLAPKVAPKLGEYVGPMFKSTVRGAYKLGQKTKEFVAETNEHVQDIVAEVDAETKGKAASSKDAAPSA